MQIRIDPLDKQFSLYIRTRAKWRCERCGVQHQPPTSALHCSHFHGRSNKQVRWDEDNANAHCYGCHQYLGSHPLEFTEWKKKQLGDKKFEELNRRANWRSGKVDTKLIKLYLDELMGIKTKEKKEMCCGGKYVKKFCALHMGKPEKKKQGKRGSEE